MLKRKGFTLVELLAVITIVGLISIIVIPLTNSYLKKAQEDTYNSQINEIKKAANKWALQNAAYLPEKENETVTIYLGDLKKAGYLGKDYTNVTTKQKYPDNLEILITYKNNRYVVEVDDESGDEMAPADLNGPTVVLKGMPYEEVEVNTEYKDKGVIALTSTGTTIPSSNIVMEVSPNNNTQPVVDTSVLQTYEVTYEVTHNGKTVTVRRKVKVVDTIAPLIMVPPNTILSSTQASFDIRTGVTTSDNSGEVIGYTTSSNLKLKVPGTYVVTYTAKDSSGNTKVKKRTISIVNDVCTEIVVKGTKKSGEPSTVDVTLSATLPNGSMAMDTTYQWQRRTTTGSWSNISGATSKDYQVTTNSNYIYRVNYKQYLCNSSSNEYQVILNK
jgi:prepilin-type N-terminal cleavage/methylation domain